MDLWFEAENALAALRQDQHRDVMQLIAEVLVRTAAWPALGGWEITTDFGPRSWIMIAAYPDGIDSWTSEVRKR